MTKISELLAEGPTLSFEFFPPKTDKGMDRLRQTIADLDPLDPSFVSVTYGAGGSTRSRTKEVVQHLNTESGLMPMPHLTCIAHTRDELTGILGDYREEGLDNILALHGDPPRSDPDMASGELTRAIELVELVREVGDFSVGVAAHPEGHPKAPDPGTDRTHQATKLRAADFGVTQFFFDVDDYLQFTDEMDRRDVTTPIIPGVIPITDVKQVETFAAMSGASFPAELAERLESAADDPAEVRRIGVEVATETCGTLLDKGAPGLHLYTLNRSQACVEVATNLGLGRAAAGA